MSFQNKICEQIYNHLNIIYPKSNNTHLTNKIFSIFFEKKSPKQYVIQNRWDESDVALITYLDTFYNNDEKNIQTLEQVLNTYLQDNVSIIHLLPFFPYSSDDGFAVIDYLKIKKGLATWSDIKKLSLKYKIMADLVINHCSSQSEWFQQFLNNQLPGKSYFLDYKDKFDTSKIVRPRSHDLLQIFKTKKSEKFVWCTFSRDQVDLNFKNKDVLIEFLKIIKFYLDQGISILRLDAVAFLWKKLGTNCINLNETHEVIKLFRLLLDASSQKTFLITETNLPNKENLDYFGNGNEAQLIYNFSLPPLILYSMLYGNSTILRKWLMSMPPPMEGTTYFNFIASHDGIGIRPAEGLISEKNIKAILRRMKEFGGEVSYRKVENKNKPYEINIALIDALKGTIDNLDNFQIERFICAHAIMLSLEGIPAIYVHSFFGTENDYSGMQSTKQKRSINRKRYNLKDLRNKMNKKTINSTVLKQLNSLISIRKIQPAFHPNATQFTLNLGEKIFALWRQCQNRKQSIFVLCNITSQKQPVDLNEINLIFNKNWIDLISNKKIESKKISLKPYQTMWISNY
jgi:sucrose phosphorylase